jgi:hypothetical protein
MCTNIICLKVLCYKYNNKEYYGSFTCAIFLYYIILLLIIFKIVNTDNFFFKKKNYGFSGLENMKQNK